LKKKEEVDSLPSYIVKDGALIASNVSSPQDTQSRLTEFLSLLSAHRSHLLLILPDSCLSRLERVKAAEVMAWVFQNQPSEFKMSRDTIIKWGHVSDP